MEHLHWEGIAGPFTLTAPNTSVPIAIRLEIETVAVFRKAVCWAMYLWGEKVYIPKNWTFTHLCDKYFEQQHWAMYFGYEDGVRHKNICLLRAQPVGKTGKQLPYCGRYGNRKNRGPIHLYLKKSGFKGLTGGSWCRWRVRGIQTDRRVGNI